MTERPFPISGRTILQVIVAAALLVVAVLYPRFLPSGPEAYTLYRNSGTDMTETGYSAMRIHIATFDADESEA